MSEIIFDKAPLTAKDHIEHLGNKGLRCKNKIVCCAFIEKVSYYRLSGYWQHLIVRKPQYTSGFEFRTDAFMEQAISAYNLDTEIKSIVLGLLSYYETALKTKLINISLNIPKEDIFPHVQSHFYESDKLFNKADHRKNLEKVRSDIQDNLPRLKFINDYKSKYDIPIYPPIWMITELMSFGDISKWVKSIHHTNYLDIIAKQFGFSSKSEFDNTNFILTNLRNICAHNGRLFNNDIYGNRQQKQSIASLRGILVPNSSRHHVRLWNSLVLVMYGLVNVGYADEVRERVDLLDLIFQDYSNQMYVYYSFPHDWQNMLNKILFVK